jgi:hypothetical protein
LSYISPQVPLTSAEVSAVEGLNNLAISGATQAIQKTGANTFANVSLSGAGGGVSGTINEITYFNTATSVASLPVATYPSLTELSYVKGVTSAIQTQLGLLAPKASPVFTTQITTPLIYGSSAANGDITIEGTSDATKTTSYVILQPTSGNVGIGTATPSNKLSIVGAASAANTVSIDNTAGTGRGLQITNTTNATQYALGIDTQTYGIYLTNVDTSSNKTSLDIITGGVDRFLVRNDGNVGIGTTTPAYPLDVYGVIRSGTGGFKFPDATTQTTAYLGGSQTLVAGNVGAGAFGSNTSGGNYSFPASLSIGTSTAPSGGVLFVNGNVGIGTAGPTAILDVYKTGQSNTISVGSDTNYQSALWLRYQQNTGTGMKMYYDANTAVTYLDSVYASTAGQAYGDVAFRTNTSGTAKNLLYLQNTSGNVGIGTTGPTARLHLPASTATAGTASLKIAVGVGLTTPEAGAIFFDGTDLFIDI